MAEPENSPDEELRRLIIGHELEQIKTIHQRQQVLLDRVGDDRRLGHSIQRIIVDVLRDARVNDHDRLAAILAPLVLSSLREEIRNSRELMVEALYPITGRLVAAAVRNAFTEMLRTIEDRLNNTLSYERLKLRFRALATGQPVSVLLLQAYPIFSLESVLVIHRASGLLIAARHRSDMTDRNMSAANDTNTEFSGQGNNANASLDGDMVGGLLTAIMAFSREAFGQENDNELRTLEIDNGNLLIRCSPTLIMAVKSTGPVPAAFQRRYDDQFNDFVSRWSGDLSDFNGILENDAASRLDNDLSICMTVLSREEEPEKKQPSRKAYYAAATLVTLLIGLWGWQWYISYRDAKLIERAAAVITEQESLRNYPLEVSIVPEKPPKTIWTRLGNWSGFTYSPHVRISGLVPMPSSAGDLQKQLTATLPGVAVDLEVTALQPDATPGEPDILQQVAAILRDEPAMSGFPTEYSFDPSSQTLLIAGLVPDEIVGQRVLARIAELAQQPQNSSAPAIRVRAALTPLRIPDSPPSPMQILQKNCDEFVVQFSKDSLLRDPLAAGEKFDRLAGIFQKAPAPVKLRIVGYSDEIGSSEVNLNVTLQRAEFVAESLGNRGIAADRLIPVGRPNEKLLNNGSGENSENRRVECEMVTP